MSGSRGGGRNGSGSGGTSGSGSGGSASGAHRSSSISSSGSSKSATSYGGGGGKSMTIPSGQLFAGRTFGGGTRSEVYGNRFVVNRKCSSSLLIFFIPRQYGSGYPGISGRAMAGRGFPFVFWPLAWGGIAGVSTAAYMHSTEVDDSDSAV